MMLARGYRIRSYVNSRAADGTEYSNYSLTVPKEIAEHLPDGMTFQPRMTEEGILYQPISLAKGKPELPDWAKSSNGTHPKEKSQAESDKSDEREENENG